MLRMLRSIALSSILVSAPHAALIAADGNGKGPAFTSAPENDPNFALMGEFIGDIQVDGKNKRPLGLQIRHVGHGSFEALSFWVGCRDRKAMNQNP